MLHSYTEYLNRFFCRGRFTLTSWHQEHKHTFYTELSCIVDSHETYPRAGYCLLTDYWLLTVIILVLSHRHFAELNPPLHDGCPNNVVTKITVQDEEQKQVQSANAGDDK